MKLAYIRCNHRICLMIYICYGIKNLELPKNRFKKLIL